MIEASTKEHHDAHLYIDCGLRRARVKTGRAPSLLLLDDTLDDRGARQRLAHCASPTCLLASPPCLLASPSCLLARGSGRARRVKWTKDGAKYDAVEDDGSEDDVGTLPSVLRDEEGAERREDERPCARSAHCDARGERALLVEVVSHHHDRRQVHEPKPHSWRTQSIN